MLFQHQHEGDAREDRRRTLAISSREPAGGTCHRLPRILQKNWYQEQLVPRDQV